MIKAITLINIQAHKYTTVNFPQNGVVRIYGPNSAGKTAIFKPLYDAIENNLGIPQCRDELINADSDGGIYTVELYTGYAMTINLFREANKVLITMLRPDGTFIKRTLRDRVFDELMDEMGFHYSPRRSASLHIHKANTELMFMSQNNRENYELLTNSLLDPKTLIAQENEADLIKELKAEQKTTQSLLAVSEIKKANLAFVDEVKTSERMEQAQKYINLLKCFVSLELREIREPKYFPIEALSQVKVVYNSIKNHRFPHQTLPKAFEILQKVKAPNHLLNEVAAYLKFKNSILQGICPTCGQETFETKHEH